MSRKILITRDNYEIFAVDYGDGNLSAEEEKAFLDFLKRHPELEEEAALFFEAEPLPITTDCFPQKRQLKQAVVNAVAAIDENSYETYFVAALENDLTADEQKKLSEFLRQNTHLQEEFELTQKMKAAPGKPVVFPNKTQLKQRKPVFRYLYYGISSVAAVLLMLFLFRLGNQNERPQKRDFEKEIVAPAVSGETLENDLITDNKAVIESSAVESELFSDDFPENVVSTTATRPIAKPVFVVATRQPETLPSKQSDIVVGRPLQPSQILLRNVEAETLAALAKGEAIADEKSGDEKNRFWNFLTWGAKKYNQITGEQVKLIKIEDEGSRSAAYFVE